jgi:N-acetylglutamate synthase-like GNAT family acetyltransferase
MNVSNFQVRRATVDDLVPLRRLWQQAQLPVAELEKRLTEFQVVETADGDLLGAVGLRIQKGHGHVHSEVYRNPDQADELRGRLWERLLSLARNHGLMRLWLENGASMFWLEHGFEVAGSELQKSLPDSFGTREGQNWLTLTLRQETEAGELLEQEFAIFRESQRQETAHVARRAQFLRWLAAFLVCAVLLLVAFSVWAALHLKRKGRP